MCTHTELNWLLNQVKHYQLTHLLNIIDQCAETDYKLKSSYMDKQLILELFILSLYKKFKLIA